MQKINRDLFEQKIKTALINRGLHKLWPFKSMCNTSNPNYHRFRRIWYLREYLNIQNEKHRLA